MFLPVAIVVLLALRKPHDVSSQVPWHSVRQLIQDYQTQFCPEMTCNRGPRERHEHSLTFAHSAGTAKTCSPCCTCHCDAACHKFRDCCPELQLDISRPLDGPDNCGVTADKDLKHERLKISFSTDGTDQNTTEDQENITRRIVKRFATLSADGEEDNSSNGTKLEWEFVGGGKKSKSGDKGGDKSGDKLDSETQPCLKLNSDTANSENDNTGSPLDHAEAVQMRRNTFADQNGTGYSKSFQCTPVTGNYYWMIDSCQPGDPNYTEARAEECRQGWQEDPLSLSPVTVITTRGRDVTFKNRHCAVCHDVSRSQFTFWQVQVKCSDSVQLPAVTNTTQLLQHALHEAECKVHLLPPPKSFPITCVPPDMVISNCSTNSTDENAAMVHLACSAYTLPFQFKGEIFGNIFCYLCNGGRRKHLSTSGRTYHGDEDKMFGSTMSSLLTFMQRPWDEQSLEIEPTICQPDAIYDPTEARCKKVVCPVYREAFREVDGTVSCQWIFRQMEGINIQVLFLLRPSSHNVTLKHDQINATERRVIASLRKQLQEKGNLSMSFARVYGIFTDPVKPSSNTSGLLLDQDVIKRKNHTNGEFKVKLFCIQMLVRNDQPEDPDTTFETLYRMFNSSMSLQLGQGRMLSVTANLLQSEEFMEIATKTTPTPTTAAPAATTKASVPSSRDDTTAGAASPSPESEAAEPDREDVSLPFSGGDEIPVAEANVQNVSSSEEQDTEWSRTVVFSLEWPPGATVKPGMLHSPVPLLTRLNCPAVKISANRFTVSDDGVVFLHVFDTRLYPGESFQLSKEHDLLICVDTFVAMAKRYQQKAMTPKEKYPFLIITTFLQSVGFVCLLLTIVALLWFPELRTVPGYNLLFLSLSLLLAHLPLALPLPSLFHPTVCRAMAIWLHYCWLLVFAWMTIASCHMYCSFRNLLRAVHPQTQTNSPVKSYCALAFVAPLFIVVGHMVANYWFSSGKSTGYARARSVCFLSGNVIAVVTFATPLVLTVLTTTSLLALTVYSMRRTANDSRIPQRTYSSNSINYCKLSTLTGLTWGVGVVGVFTGSDVIVMAFNVLCGAHGLFLFLAFIANRRTGRLLLAALKTGPNLNRSRHSSHPTSRSQNVAVPAAAAAAVEMVSPPSPDLYRCQCTTISHNTSTKPQADCSV